MKKYISKIWSASYLLVPFAIYALSAFPTVTTEDSGELIAAAYHLGIPHPPGYPLFMMAGKLGSILIPFGNIAWRINMVSALFGALTCFLIGLFIQKNTKSNLAAFAAAILLAVTNIFWSQAIRAEVYTIGTFFLALLIYVSHLWYETKSKKKKKHLLYLVAFLIGLGSTAHQLILLTAPALAIYFMYYDRTLWKNRGLILEGVFFFLLGFSVWLYHPIRSAANPLIDWGNPENWENFWRVFFRSVYTESGSAAAAAQQAAQGITPPPPPPPTITETLEAFRQKVTGTGGKITVNGGNMFMQSIKNLFIDYSVIPFSLGIYGIYSLKKSRKEILFLITSLFLFVGIFFSYFLFITPKLYVHKFINIPFFTPIVVLFAIPIGFGILALQKKLSTFSIAKKHKFIIPLLIISIPFCVGLSHLPKNYQRDNTIVYDLSRLFLNQVPKDSILYINQGDNTIFPAAYLYYVENFRNDLTIFVRSSSTLFNDWQNINDTIAQYPDRWIFTDFITEESKNIPHIYLGFITQIVPSHQFHYFKDTQKLKTTAREYVEKGIFRDKDHNLDFFHQYVRGLYYYFQGLAYDAIDIEKRDYFLKKAYKTAPLSGDVFTNLLSRYYMIKKEDHKALPYLIEMLNYTKVPLSYEFKIGEIYLEKGDKQKAWQYFNLVYQKSPYWYFKLQGEFFERTKNIPKALDNYKKALEINPKDTSLTQKIEKFSENSPSKSP